ncbi:MAG TPA: hypothetical protein VFP68_16870 [Burkholderiaceae bacterium]|nr:hypothetical protein [Burkholderiaceae bacterium]
MNSLDIMFDRQGDGKVAVLQSFRTSDVPEWIALCMNSVRRWAQSQGWEYHLLDDRFLDLPPPWVRQRCGRNLYAVTDVARLIWAQEVLSRDHERVIWADADILVFDPDRLAHHMGHVRGHGFARELFLRLVAGGRTEPQWGINNALMVFDRGDSVLVDYLQACMERLEAVHDRDVPRTALGPALLQQLDDVCSLKLIEGVGLFTPAMLGPFATGRDALMRLYFSHCTVPPAAANLCHFMRNATAPAGRPMFDHLYETAVVRLMREGMRFDTAQGTATQRP